MPNYQISAEVDARVSGYVRGMQTVVSQTEKAAKAVDKGVNKISDVVTSKLAGIFSLAAVVGFGKAIVDVTAEFQKFNAVLSTTYGSSALASLKLKEIQDFAAKTPYGIAELTGAFVKLANSGFKPTGDQMRALGDLAASTGKSFDMLAEAIIDAQTGEFERLKEFGVRAKDAGDKVIFTYRGVQTQVEKSSVAIREYITNLGNAAGTSGSMAKISATLGGQISNLGDNWDKMLLSIGNNTQGVFSKAITIIGRALDKITQYNDEVNLAEKYDLGSDFGNQLARAVNPFGGKGATDIELAAYAIKLASKNVGDLVSKAQDGAKNVNDFGKALADLKKAGDQALVAPNVGKKGEALTEKTRAAIKAEYQEGVKAIQDARRNFETAGTASANFGTKAKSAIKSVADIMKELDLALVTAKNQFGDSFSDVSKSKIDAYQKAIDELIKKGVNPASDAIIKLKQNQQDLFQLPSVTVSELQTSGTNQESPALVGDVGLRGFDKIKAEHDRIKKLQEQFNEDINGLVQSGLTNTISSISDSIGTALAEGGNVFAAAGQGLLGAFGSFLTQFGKMLVEYGAAAVLKGKLDAAVLIPGGGIIAGAAAIAAGIALQIAGAAFGKLLGGAKGGSNSNVTAFANGGVVSGPTNALVGEYPGAKNNPEVIAPLDKLRSLIGNNTFQPILIPIANSKQLAILVKDGTAKLNRQ